VKDRTVNGTFASIASARRAAVWVICRPVQDGQTPRTLHEKRYQKAVAAACALRPRKCKTEHPAGQVAAELLFNMMPRLRAVSDLFYAAEQPAAPGS